MSNSFMADIGAMGAASVTAKKSTSREGNTELKMEDFLTLMVVQLQNQTIDDTADTGEMLNQLVQMQMVTALSNMTDASVMSYASSLVGKEVTIGYLDNENKLHEEVLNVIGTGLYDGQQVIFCDDGKMYQLSQIMAVGHLPDLEETGEGDENDNEYADFEKETKDRVDALNASIKDGSFDADSTDSTGSATDAGAVKEPESAQESNNDAGSENSDGTVDPLKGGLLDGMLADPTYKGEQGTDTYATE
ncbi:MAG: hypothetical protein NC319_01710 [Butyricicoccus sp.]|nr:hypothetical protein [Butyricicoccus sp.]